MIICRQRGRPTYYTDLNPYCTPCMNADEVLISSAAIFSLFIKAISPEVGRYVIWH